MTTSTDAVPSTWAPDRIWLQREQGDHGSHTWCEDSVGDGDIIEEVEYIRADRAKVQADHIADERKMVAGEWQTIETAPKTGRTLLLGYPNSLGKWRTVRGQWMSEAYIAEDWEDPDDVEPGWFETAVEAEGIPNCWPISPTHWMPLPAAPASSTGNQEVGS